MQEFVLGTAIVHEECFDSITRCALLLGRSGFLFFDTNEDNQIDVVSFDNPLTFCLVASHYGFLKSRSQK